MVTESLSDNWRAQSNQTSRQHGLYWIIGGEITFRVPSRATAKKELDSHSLIQDLIKESLRYNLWRKNIKQWTSPRSTNLTTPPHLNFFRKHKKHKFLNDEKTNKSNFFSFANSYYYIFLPAGHRGKRIQSSRFNKDKRLVFIWIRLRGGKK